MITNYGEWYWDHNQYYRTDWGDKKISCPPLINTSLKELSNLHWSLSAEARYLPKHDSTKIKFQFHAPPGQTGWPFLTYKGWVKSKKIHSSNLMLDLLYTLDLTPTFSKPPSFSLIPQEREKQDKFIEKIMKEDEDLVSLRQKNMEQIRKMSL